MSNGEHDAQLSSINETLKHIREDHKDFKDDQKEFIKENSRQHQKLFEKTDALGRSSVEHNVKIATNIEDIKETDTKVDDISKKVYIGIGIIAAVHLLIDKVF